MEKAAEKNGNGSPQIHDGGWFKTKLTNFESVLLSYIKTIEFVLVELSDYA